MMRILKYTAALAAAALFAACVDDPAEQTPQPQGGDLPIRWDVKDVASSVNATRVMIGEPPETGGTSDKNRPVYPIDPDFYVTLPEVCTTYLASDPYKDKGFAIGLFGNYTYKDENNQDVTVNDLYSGARLVYLPEVEIAGEVLSQWDTDVALKYWHPGAKYTFRAYYPQRLYNYTIQNSDATTMAMVYPSRKLQYDLLLGAKEVDTGTDHGAMQRAVEIQMKHALAALRFEFRLGFKDADLLTSVYLISDDEESRFFSQGTVTYTGAGETESTKWLQDYNPPAKEVLYKWVPPLKYWYGEGVDTNSDGVIDEYKELSADEMLERWGWVNGAPNDVPLVPVDESGVYNTKYNPVLMYSNHDMVALADNGNTSGAGNTNSAWTGKWANAYYGMEQYYHWNTAEWSDKQWKYSAADEVAAEGKLYCRNSGWLLIPPQQSFGKLTLCFTTKRGGEAVYKVALPEYTGTMIDTNGKVMKDKAGKFITESKDGTYAWVEGVRYTYSVTLSQTNLGVSISIDPWNERKHSTEIIF